MKRITSVAQRPRLQRGADIEAELRVTLERVAQGGDENLRLSRPRSCPACHGSGCQNGVARRRCEACQGSGHIMHSHSDHEPLPQTQGITPCATCYGRGSLIDHPCAMCRGAGTIAREETLIVTIPRGVADDSVLRIAGQGMPSPDAAGNAGDLLVRVQALPDPRFERDGANLLHSASITLTDAVLGTTRTLPTLDEIPAHLAIPPGTQPGTVLSLPGRGLPVADSERYGELQVRIQVLVPDALSRKERLLYERLRALAVRPATDTHDAGQPGASRSVSGG